MNRYIINLKSGVDTASPCVTKYNSGFDTIRFRLGDGSLFSDCIFSVVVSVMGQVNMISEEENKLVRGYEENEMYLDWTIGTEITCDDGVVIYQVVAYKSGNDGETEAVWYSPQGRIAVGDSIDTTEYEAAQMGASPGILMRIMEKCALSEKKMESIESELENAVGRLSAQESKADEADGKITQNAEKISENAEDINLIDSRLTVSELKVDNNSRMISENAEKISENAEDINLIDSRLTAQESKADEADGKITQNAEKISKNAEDINLIDSRLTVSESKVDNNSMRIAENSENISENAENISLINSALSMLNDETGANQKSINDHKSDISNPHEVTKDQIGLSNVDNTSDMDKPVSTATSEALAVLEEKITFENFCENQFIRHVDIMANIGGYISSLGTFVSSSDFSYTDPISLHKNEKIVVKARGYDNGKVNVSVITLVAQGTNVPVVKSINDKYTQYEYTADRDCSVIISFTTRLGVTADVYLCVNDALGNINSKINEAEKSAISKEKEESLNYFEEERITFPYEDCTLNKIGNLDSKTDRAVSDYIDLKKFGQIYRYGYSAIMTVMPMCFYDENYNLIGFKDAHVPESFDSVNGHTNANLFNLMENARYIRITCEMSRTSHVFMAVPRKNIFTSGDVLLDIPTRFLLGSDKTIVTLGDSIFGNNDTSTGVSNLIAGYTNAKVYNCAFGGTRMSIRGNQTTGYDKFDFPSLVTAIVSGDYSPQEDAIANYSLPSYYGGRVERLKGVDFSKVDVVTLNFGTNDYTGGVKIENFKSQGLDCIIRLQQAFPNITVVLITPAWRLWLDTEGNFAEDSDTKTYPGGTLVDFCNAGKEIAGELHLPVIDVYNIGINKYNWSDYFASADTTHQAENGRKKLARIISKGLACL